MPQLDIYSFTTQIITLALFVFLFLLMTSLFFWHLTINYEILKFFHAKMLFYQYRGQAFYLILKGLLQNFGSRLQMIYRLFL